MKRAVVLAGGGARGPYQIGVWSALRALGIEYHIVTGSSVGALNGAMMVQDEYHEARRLWESITTTDVVSLPELPAGTLSERRSALGEFLRTVVLHGGLDVSPLEHTLRGIIDEDKIRSSPVEFGLVTTAFPLLRTIQLRKSEIPHGELVDYLLASAAYFPFFQRQVIHDVKYMDGAYSDNFPVQLALRCGAEEIIAVDLHGTGIVHRYRGKVPVTCIYSHWDLGQILLFDPERARQTMQMGYQDALKAFHRLEGHAYAFYRGETRRNTARMHNALKQIRFETGVDVFSRYEKLPQYRHAVRYRQSRLLRPTGESFTLGRAVTIAGEITGELLNISPARIYRFPEFNRCCLEAWQQRQQIHTSRDSLPLHMLHRYLEHARVTGHLPDLFWGLASLFPQELIAASYLLALERMEG